MSKINKEATDKAEQIGRQYFDMNYPSFNKYYSPETYSWWDVSGNTSGSKYIAEIKVRDYKIEDFTTIMMEKYKYDKLTEYSNESGIPAYYINYFFDAEIVLDLATVDLAECEQKEIMLPESTVESGEKVYVKKPCVLVPKEKFYINDNGQNKLNKLLKSIDAY